MRHLGKVIQGGDTLFVPKGDQWVRWTISDFSPGTGQIFGRLSDGGPYEPMPRYARWDVPQPKPKPPKSPGTSSNWSFGSWQLG